MPPLLFLYPSFLCLFLGSEVRACMAIDSQFTLNVGNLKIDTKKLENLCSQETCVVSDDYITLRSHFDERVEVIIGKTSSILGFKGITVRLPYIMREENYPVVSEIKPEEYDWKGSVRKDLYFLMEVGVLQISGSDIEIISSLSSSSSNLRYCGDKWKQLSSNCDCEGNCARCMGGPALKTHLPERLLGVSTTSK